MTTTQTQTPTPSLASLIAAARVLRDTDALRDDATDDDRLDAASTLIRAGWALDRAAAVLGLYATDAHVHAGTAWVSDDYVGETDDISEDADDLQAWADEHAQHCAEIAVGSGGTSDQPIIWRYSAEIEAVDADGDRVTVTGHGEAVEEPPAAKCVEADDGEHEWCSPFAVVGGIKENPGVQGHGGGVIITEVCRHCGTYRTTDTWATGHDGRPTTTVTYREADDASLAWIDLERAAAAEWRFESSPTPDDDRAVGCDLVAADGTIIAGCLWAGGGAGHRV